MYKKILPTLVILMLLAPSHSFAKQSADSIVARIKARGANLVVQETYRNPAEWSSLMASIKSGDSAWLEVARLLSPGTDGSSAEELTVAAGDALENNPTDTLRILWPTFRLGMCQFLPDQTEPRYHTFKQAIGSLEKRLRKLRGVTTPNLVPARDACITELRSWRREVEQMYGK